MTFSALDSALTGPLFATDAMRRAFSDRARIAAMLKVEAALAAAQARHDLVPKALAPAVAAISVDNIDFAAVGAKTADSGVITVPFVKAVEVLLPENLRGHFHFGTTSQDILDTATVLQMRDGFDLIQADLSTIIDGLGKLAKTHRTTPMVGRTYGQHAAPITFGYAAALWLTGIRDVAAQLPALRERVLTASLGGPVGILAALGEKGPAIADDFGRRLGLSNAPISWHSLKGRLAETGSWLGMVIGSLAKMATDVVHLSSTEVGEVAEPHAGGRGGSSAMPHKRNPISSSVIIAAGMAAPGHVSTLLATMSAADQRPAGTWQAEWHALPQLFGLASGALREGRRIAEGLVVDKARMRANLDLTKGLLFSDAVSAALAPKLGRKTAHEIIAAAADAARETGAPLQDVLARDGRIPSSLQKAAAAAFDPAPAIDAAAASVDRVLAAGKRRQGNKKR